MSDTIDRLVTVANDIAGYVPSIVHSYSNDPTSIDEDKISNLTTMLQSVYDELKRDEPGSLVPAIVENAPGIKPVAEPHKEDVPASPPVENVVTPEDIERDRESRSEPPSPNQAEPIQAEPIV